MVKSTGLILYPWGVPILLMNGFDFDVSLILVVILCIAQ